MAKRTRQSAPRPDHAPVSLGELIHNWVRRAIETAVHEELEASSAPMPCGAPPQRRPRHLWGRVPDPLRRGRARARAAGSA